MATSLQTWQQWLDAEIRRLRLTRTSGYRSPGEEAALGGPAASYHTHGTPANPGAIDVGGPADALRTLFEEIKGRFHGRINELYLNVPGGQSVAIKNDRYLGTNPENGRPQHLHVALGDGSTTRAPAYDIPLENRGDKALAVTGGDACSRSWCPPDFKGMIQSAIGGDVTPQDNCVCWSDTWMYGAALFLFVGGSWLVFKGAGK